MKKNAFTLVELLIVIAIIGIFTAILFGSISSSKAKGRDVRRITDMKQIQIALALYLDNKREYPVGLSTLTDDKYMSEIPVDPQTGAAYEYQSSAPYRHYCIGVTLEGDIPNDNASCLPSGSVSNYTAKK
jgi:prepilin-type N-terminal cleavage/methylation domain-containing protein